MRIAFIGLGAMGLPMAKNLAKVAGLDLVAYDVSAERLKMLDGHGRPVGSIEDAVKGADAVFTVLPADQHVRSVAAEVAAARAGNTWFIDFSTIAPATIDEVADQLAAVGTETISAVLTRSTAAAQAGNLGLFVGGCTELPEPLRDPFDAMAGDVVIVGSNASAKAFKIVNNMVVAILDILICESIVLAGLAGLPGQAVVDALEDAGVTSWVLQNHIVKYVLPDDLGPGRFSTRYMAKDVSLCNAFAQAHATPAFFAGLATSYYRGSVAHGYGDDYHMKVIRWLETGAAAPRTMPADGAELLAALVQGVAAVQYLVSYEALELAALAGIEPVAAANHFEAGSAGNAGLDWWRLGKPGEPPSLHQLVAQVGGVLDWAVRLNAPVTTFELARHRALTLAAGGSLDRPLWAR